MAQVPYAGIPEQDHGNVEYKLKIKADDKRADQLASQMKFRLFEGNGEAIYVLGITDDGIPEGISPDEMNATIEQLNKIAEKINAKTTILRKIENEGREIAEILVRKIKDPEKLPVDIPIVSLGNVDAGKSTLIGVLKTGKLDDGRGSARTAVFRHKHELETGRTSSISSTTIGIDIDGNIINQDPIAPPSDLVLLEKSIKTISFHDLAGHEKYLKTTIYGLSGLSPKYAMLVVAANQGILRMTKEHMGLIIALKLPMFVVITKIDLTPQNVLNKTKNDLKKLFKIPGVNKVPLIVKNNNDVILAAQHMEHGNVIPVFMVSTTNGQNLNFLQQFLNLLPAKKPMTQEQSKDFGAYITEIFSVPGVGTVVSASIYSGSVSTNEKIYVGPFEGGTFKLVRIKSIHYKRVNAERVFAGQSATFALHTIKKDEVRKGMVLLSARQTPGASFRFDGEVYVLYHSTTIKIGYSPVIHTQSIQQSAKIIAISQPVLRTGDKATVSFQFLYRPEHVSVGQRFIFREGRTKGIGTITKIYPIDPTE